MRLMRWEDAAVTVDAMKNAAVTVDAVNNAPLTVDATENAAVTVDAMKNAAVTVDATKQHNAAARLAAYLDLPGLARRYCSARAASSKSGFL